MRRSVTEIYFHASSLRPILTSIDPTIRLNPAGLITAYTWTEDVKYDEIGIRLPFRPNNRFDKKTRHPQKLEGLISIPLGHVASIFTYEVDGPEIEELTKKIGFKTNRDAKNDDTEVSQ